jgi:hypothetical protein
VPNKKKAGADIEVLLARAGARVADARNGFSGLLSPQPLAPSPSRMRIDARCRIEESIIKTMDYDDKSFANELTGRCFSGSVERLARPGG